MGTGSTADLSTKSALVTGATSGIGFSTARRLAVRGATMLVTGRDPHRGAEAAIQLRQAAGHERVEFLPVDHATVRCATSPWTAPTTAATKSKAA